MHRHIHACTHVHTHAHMHACMHARTHACTHTRTHACTHARTHACTHARTHAHKHRHTVTQSRHDQTIPTCHAPSSPPPLLPGCTPVRRSLRKPAQQWRPTAMICGTVTLGSTSSAPSYAPAPVKETASQRWPLSTSGCRTGYALRPSTACLLSV